MTSTTTVRILQIGDIHYPSATTSRPSADLKRDAFDISGEIAPEGARFQKITQTLSQYTSGYFHGIVFMGDYTTGSPNVSSQLAGLTSCLDYVQRNILSPLLGKDSRVKALFVPGNHDVDRTRCPTTPDTRSSKFEHYVNTLGALGHKNISGDTVSRVSLTVDDSEVILYGLNSCLGCGEYMSFPEKTKADLAAQLADLFKRGVSEVAENIITDFFDLTEQLDAPVIDGATLHELDLQLEKCSRRPDAVQIVVGYHSLLPQPIPRVAPFSELVNSGELRAFLSTKETPIVYLHGHIHQNPIEIVYSQERPDSCVISISAPEFSSGYNILEVEFDENGVPLGIVVIPIRQDGLGKISKPSPRKIPFRQGKHRIAAITELAREIFYKTFSANSQFHFNELCKAYSSAQAEAVERAVVELEWLGLVEIANRHRKPEQWNIRSAV
ncbi:metallophosphoesterase [Bradyrhizobium sp. B124]|uniref:metallophosphoesterase family protein n=1 Tax=Bradyrhizobium sp. B124 TaxID=3140245 RepID=UPI003183E7C1